MADGGNVELAEIDGLVVKLKLIGACGSCPSRSAPFAPSTFTYCCVIACVVGWAVVSVL